ncbi:Transcriptional regulator [Paraburkholderia ribeironis]|uniref:Transcriptional regulator n=1 Tax=Paraburkholderia ribeironis TaxID=1247936 RepID=A0A1N7RXN1_9BURK|nr:GntR family transcriptional regulator [Paraburkholderia ribeironis]SIT39809.1 Transcriptional regulator [Paraburkholderia ribeironis]
MTTQTSDLPEFEARRRSSDLEYIYDALKQSFMIGEFVPGQRVTLPVLASAFGTSQMPIREATNRLVVARALEALPRRSLRVPQVTTERLDALLPLRLQLEGEATRLATRPGSKGLAVQLKKINDEMYGKAALKDVKSFLRLNQRFHFTVYENCGNHDLVDLIELLWMRYGPLMNVVHNGVLSDTGKNRHLELIAAIKEEDPKKASAAIRADIAEAAAKIREVIAAQTTRMEEGVME